MIKYIHSEIIKILGNKIPKLYIRIHSFQTKKVYLKTNIFKNGRQLKDKKKMEIGKNKTKINNKA